MKIAVLGSGMVGRTMAIDLAQKHEVTSLMPVSRHYKYLKQRHQILQLQKQTCQITVHTQKYLTLSILL